MPENFPHPSSYVEGSLLDRLTAPSDRDVMTGTRQPAGGGAVPGLRAAAYQDTVLRDLEWLFNASSPLSEADAELRRKYPYAASSVLGYGLRGILGRVVHDTTEIEDRVRRALAAFEPRLVIEDMKLEVSREGQLIEIEIKGLLLTQQAKRQLWIRTDLETLQSKLRVEANG